MKKKRLVIVIAAVLVGAVCLALGAFAVRENMPYVRSALSILGIRADKSANEQDPVHELYKQKHPYIGRLPDLPLSSPNDVYHYGQGQQTVKQPYGYQRWYGTDFETCEQYRTDPAKQRIFMKNALIMMALIDNCDFVEITVRWDNEKIDYNNYPGGTSLRDMGQGGVMFTYTREWADKAIGGDIKKAAETEENFRAFLAGMDSYDLAGVEATVTE